MDTNNLNDELNLPEKGAGETNQPETNAGESEANAENSTEEKKVEPQAEQKENESSQDDKSAVTTESDVAEKPEDESVKEKNKTPKFVAEDYSTFEKTILLTKLNTLINNYEVKVIKDAVEDIKLNFYKKHKAEIAEAKRKFEEEGNNPEDFKYTADSSEETFKELYKQYRDKKAVLTQSLEQEKKQNLEEKYKIIEEINVLINKEESINKTFQEFRDLQVRWREVGLVPQNELKNLWETYNHTVEKFYDYIKINKELRDLDLKKNLEEKVMLCEKAEALLLEESINKAFKTLQEYHQKWREVGPVPREQKDDLWERFKAATTQINKKHQQYFEGLKDQQANNLEQKTALCVKVEEIDTSKLLKPKEWEDKANEIIEIQKLWRTIGFAPKKDNNRIYQRFKLACDSFFTEKREFYKKTKDQQKNNLQLKLDLCVQAEALKDSTEWKSSTEEFIKLQKRWKEVGSVPKKYSEALWKRFRTACDSFFAAKSEFYNTADSRQEDNLKLKLALIEKVKNFQPLDDDKENLNQLMQIQKEWTEVGHVPLAKKDEINHGFRDAINEQFDKLKIGDSERNAINYKSKVEGWAHSNSRSKLYSERNKLISKIKELENEISLYENNIGFFSASSNSNSMVDEIKRKIEKAHERMVVLKDKLRILDQTDQE